MRYFTAGISRLSKLPGNPVWIGILASLCLDARANEVTEWRDKMRAIVPQSYLCRYTTNAINVDGKLDDAAWAQAAWTSEFADIVGPAKTAPRFRTRAKMLWDDNCLYVCAELEEPHVWGTLTNHDAVIFRDPDFEVFIDPKGSTHNYYEFEMNALNTGWDLRLDKPYLDRGKPHNEWDIPGLKTAVHVRGTLNDSSDKDEGWSVEIAFPWKVLEVYARHKGTPNEGEQWRINFSRVEWQIITANGGYQKVPNTPEDNWVWSPTGVVDMHRPEMWGLLQFTRKTDGDANSVAPITGKSTRDVVLDIYHAQRDFWTDHGRWAKSLVELKWDANGLPKDAESPEISTTPDGYVCSATFTDTTGKHTWRVRQDRRLTLDETATLESEAFVSRAGELYGDAGRRAAWFLVDNMPASDRSTLSEEFLISNLKLAVDARKQFPWARTIPENMFLNDVLPYASLDEPRDEWRTDFFRLASELVRDCKTATEAAQVLNRDLFKRLNVHYNTGRKRNNQSPAESIEQGKATCTGLAIILVDACRAVGIPARIVGVPQWAQKDGNHTWAEFWDGDWHFLGADEYNKDGPDKCWFNKDAAQTVESTNPIHQVYASSWRRTGQHFPLAWDFASKEVPGVNVSARYASNEIKSNSVSKVVNVRLRDKAGGKRIVARAELRSATDALISGDQTRGETADLNDMPKFDLPDEAVTVSLRFTRNDQVREKIIPCAACTRVQTFDLVWEDLTPISSALAAAESWLERAPAERGNAPDASLTKTEAKRVASLAWELTKKADAQAMRDELSAKKLTVGEHTMKWMEKTFGDAPFGKRSLWITMHGGGSGTTAMNDANWRGYYGRYEFPPGSINVAPRAPVDAWNMWFVKPVDDLFDRLIADMVTQHGVDPNRVYLIGYSAGGDGVYQLAPRMADRFAAATMCAGHPNQVTPEGLRNLPFYLYMGGNDSAYKRNTVVREFSAKIDALQATDTDGYIHRCTVFEGFSHDMQGREAEAIPRMFATLRATWPKRVVWKQDANVTHSRFYWLERPAESIKPDELYTARVEGQTIQIEQPATGKLTLRLSDELLDLDQSVKVMMGDHKIFEGKVSRSVAAIAKSLQDRKDPASVATALLPVSW